MFSLIYVPRDPRDSPVKYSITRLVSLGMRKLTLNGNSLGSPVVRTRASTSGGASSIPGWGS